MSTLIATATDEICNFQTELKKKKKAQGRIQHVLLFQEKLQESTLEIKTPKQSAILKEF